MIHLSRISNDFSMVSRSFKTAKHGAFGELFRASDPQVGEISMAVPGAIHPPGGLRLGWFQKICGSCAEKRFGTNPGILGEHGIQVFGHPSDHYSNSLTAVPDFYKRQNQTRRKRMINRDGCTEEGEKGRS